MSHVRVSGYPFLVVILALAAVLMGAPTADLLLFGSHDHMTTAEEAGAGLSGSATAPSPDAHHCELSISPAEATHGLDLAVPVMTLSEVLERPAVVAEYTPLVPPAPPRA